MASPATMLLLARAEASDGAEGAVVGMLTLAVFRIPTGVRAWIEDVVVDQSARGQGSARRSRATPSTWPRPPGPGRSS